MNYLVFHFYRELAVRRVSSSLSEGMVLGQTLVLNLDEHVG